MVHQLLRVSCNNSYVNISSLVLSLPLHSVLYPGRDGWRGEERGGERGGGERGGGRGERGGGIEMCQWEFGQTLDDLEN